MDRMPNRLKKIMVGHPMSRLTLFHLFTGHRPGTVEEETMLMSLRADN